MLKLGRRAFITAVALVTRWFPADPRAQSFSVDDFLALSSRLTGQTNLDRDTAGTFLATLLDTPGINAARLARPDTMLERDIIVAWYTGVHQVRGETRLVTHTRALQWRALRMPAPGTCVGSFGMWAKPHQSRQP